MLLNFAREDNNLVLTMWANKLPSPLPHCIVRIKAAVYGEIFLARDEVPPSYTKRSTQKRSQTNIILAI